MWENNLLGMDACRRAQILSLTYKSGELNVWNPPTLALLIYFSLCVIHLRCRTMLRLFKQLNYSRIILPNAFQCLLYSHHSIEWHLSKNTSIICKYLGPRTQVALQICRIIRGHMSLGRCHHGIGHGLGQAQKMQSWSKVDFQTLRLPYKLRFRNAWTK